MAEKFILHVLQTNPDGTKVEVEQSFSVYELKQHMSEEQFAALLDDWLNSYDNQYNKGQRVARHLFHTHPTGQGFIIRFALGILTAFGEKTDFIDARNETPIAMCRKIKAQVESGELEKGYMI
jgi:hypothetical protein